MAATLNFSVEITLAGLQVRYSEPRRHIVAPITFTSHDTWLLDPARITWWEDIHGGRAPVSAEERALVAARIVAAARERHQMRLHFPGELPPPPSTETGSGAADELSPPDGEDLVAFGTPAGGDTRAASGGRNEPRAIDPELEELMREDPMPEAARVQSSGPSVGLMAKIETALVRVQPLADAGWDAAQSIARQLHWCRGALRGDTVETPPGPFSMGLIATREFDMYGNDPEFASLINDIQWEMNDRLR